MQNSRTTDWRTILSLGLFLFLNVASAATVVTGNVSGTWTPNGNPYILSADCTVASNQTLIIQPGVVVIIGPDVIFRVDGGITAIGTPELPVIMRGASPTNYWHGIIATSSGFTNRFNYCRLSEARNGSLEFYVSGGDHTMFVEVLNCDFFNCGGGITGFAEGFEAAHPSAGAGVFLAEIHNCVFDSVGTGCVFASYPRESLEKSASHPVITGNIFKNLSYQALLLYGWGTNISRPIFVNNTVSKTPQGISINSQNFEPVIKNNLFIENSNAVHRTGGGSAIPDLGYNCFFNNTVNFTGYPGIYGIPVIQNHNGDPCDAFYNILLDPRLLDTNRFLLSKSSPCIDAGDPAIANACPQFSHGSPISDVGAYGGPESCGWLTHGFAPVITGMPSDQSSCVGESATFKVRLEGTEPMSYRWYFNGTSLLTGETNAQLNLSNLEPNQAGLYSVTVSNTFGSVTSVVARLLVSDACVGIHLYAGLSITGMVGRTYNVDYVTNLAANNWTFVASNTFSQPQWLFIDTNTPFDAKKFFRVRLQP